jgi:hypothetical protein
MNCVFSTPLEEEIEALLPSWAMSDLREAVY